MRSRVWGLPCASAVCASSHAAAAPGLQSIQSWHRASTELQTPLTSTTPSTPSIVPSDEVTPLTTRRGEVTSPADEVLPRRTARHRRASVYRAASYGLIVTGPPPIAYSYVGHGYPCAWQRSWDGYWFRTSPCSW